MANFSIYFINIRTKELEKNILDKGILSLNIATTVIEHNFNNIIDNNIFTYKEVFDFELEHIDLPSRILSGYENVPNDMLIKIQKFHYKSGLDSYLDNTILVLQDKFLEDKEIEYALIVDKQGYVPTHNSIFNK